MQLMLRFKCHVRIFDSTWCSTETQNFAYSAFRWNTQIDQEIFHNFKDSFYGGMPRLHCLLDLTGALDV